MSLDEYNRHATLGPLAGPATSAAASAGQSAYEASHARPQSWAPAGSVSHGPRPERPRWMRRNPLSRGIAIVLVAQAAFIAISMMTRPGSPVADLLSLGCIVMSVIGVIGIVVGVKDRVRGRKSGGGEQAAASSGDPSGEAAAVPDPE
ncbi:hypothetical protein ACMT1E_11780 [Sphingomonas flavalba]|uniref:hypothetical protein n=1 Tax=Sphingomonas flavalba TaxID=2559804 RepID=UPI0039DF9E83